MLDFIRPVFFTNPMKTDDAIHYFGTAAAVARALQISKSAVSQWRRFVPIGAAVRLEKITEGKLPLEIEHYPPPISPASVHADDARRMTRPVALYQELLADKRSDPE